MEGRHKLLCNNIKTYQLFKQTLVIKIISLSMTHAHLITTQDNSFNYYETFERNFMHLQSELRLKLKLIYSYQDKGVFHFFYDYYGGFFIHFFII
jgi:hypothetical protein